MTDAWAHETVSSDRPGLRFADVATGPTPPAGIVPIWSGGSGKPAIRRAVRFGEAWHPINPELVWLREVGVRALTAASDAAQRAVPEVVVRIKARLQAEPAAPGRPLGVGTLAQVLDDLEALAEVGASEVILDTNPDAPEARDFGVERQALLEIVEAFRARAGVA